MSYSVSKSKCFGNLHLFSIDFVLLKDGHDGVLGPVKVGGERQLEGLVLEVFGRPLGLHPALGVQLDVGVALDAFALAPFRLATG